MKYGYRNKWMTFIHARYQVFYSNRILFIFEDGLQCPYHCSKTLLYLYEFGQNKKNERTKRIPSLAPYVIIMTWLRPFLPSPNGRWRLHTATPLLPDLLITHGQSSDHLPFRSCLVGHLPKGGPSLDLFFRPNFFSRFTVVLGSLQLRLSHYLATT